MGDGASSASANSSGFRISSRLLSVIAVAVLFIVSLFFWTLPFQHNRLPFGEGDSAWHFSIGDSISSSDKATFRLPYYVGIWYYGFNKVLGPFALEYPPSNHVNYALMQVFGGERFVPVLIYRAIASFLGVFAVFFLLSRLFGVFPAFISGLGLVFSFREQMIFLWGQQPTLISLIIVPVVMYAWYSYLNSFYSGSSKPVYLYLAFALLLSQYFLHIQGFLASLLILGIFTAAMAAKHRKLPVSKGNFRHFVVAASAFLVVALPFILIYIGAPSGSPPVSSLERLMQWNVPHNLVSGSFPESFVLFSYEYAPFVRLFIFTGILLLIIRAFFARSNNKELLLLSWLVGLYIIFHLDVLGIIDPGRVARMQVMEPALFFSLAALSIVWLPSAVSSIAKVRSPLFAAAKYVLAAVLAISLVTTSGEASYNNLKNAYSGIDRITPVQAEFAEWLGANLPEKAYIYDPAAGILGQWRYKKTRWMLAVSQRHVGAYDFSTIANLSYDKNYTYALLDYSDIALLASSQGYRQQALAWAAQLQQIEASLFNNTQPLYDKNNIRLYQYRYKVV